MNPAVLPGTAAPYVEQIVDPRRALAAALAQVDELAEQIIGLRVRNDALVRRVAELERNLSLTA